MLQATCLEGLLSSLLCFIVAEFARVTTNLEKLTFGREGKAGDSAATRHFFLNAVLSLRVPSFENVSMTC